MTKGKIQSGLITYLMKHGEIELLLPDGMKLEVGITQEENGEIMTKDNYCWVIATRENRSVCLDAYNQGLRLANDDKSIIYEDQMEENGEVIRRFDLV